jgi:hypothetical protein
MGGCVIKIGGPGIDSLKIIIKKNKKRFGPLTFLLPERLVLRTPKPFPFCSGQIFYLSWGLI